MLSWKREDRCCLGKKLKWSTECPWHYSHPVMRTGRESEERMRQQMKDGREKGSIGYI